MTEAPAPPRRARSSVATKIIFVVFLSTALTAVIVSWISVHSTYSFLRRKINQSYPALLAHAADRSVAWLGESREELAALARNQDLAQAVASHSSGAEAPRLLAESVAGSRFFEALIVTDAEAGVIFNVGSGQGLPEGAEPPPPDGSPQLWTAPLAWPGSPLLVSAPIDAAGGSLLHGVYRRAALRGLLGADGLGPSGGICVVDAGGRIRDRLCGHGSGGSGGPTVGRDLVELSSGGAHHYRAASGERVVGAARPLGLLGWHLLVEEPFREAFEPVYASLTRVVVIDLCIILVFSFLAWKITAAIVRPIEALSDGARRISRGELDFELPATRSLDEVGLLTETFTDMTRKLLANQKEIQHANRKLKNQNEELQRANEVLEQLSITDGLTKLHNHRFFQDHLTREIKRVRRTREPLSMLVIDIDDFKRLNDRQGHKAGDELLVGMARILSESIRENDFLARYGGEEFVVLAPVTDLLGAVSLAEKVRASVEEASFILGDSKRLTKVTVSIGVAQYKGNRRAFFQGADQALYRAKAAGKNCVVSEEEA